MKKSLNNKGVILVLVLLINSIMILTGTAVLSTALMNYKMKKINSEVKKTLYLAEAGLNEAYVITLDFVSSAMECAAKDEINDIRTAFIDFLKGNYRDSEMRKSLKSILENNTKYLVYKDGYPLINAILTEKKEHFILEVKSTYIKGNITKIVLMQCEILIPEWEIDIENSKAEDLVRIIDWKVER